MEQLQVTYGFFRLFLFDSLGARDSDKGIYLGLMRE